MTRINCIPVSELNNQMLLSEYRELPRISSLSWDWFMRFIDLPDWPTTYVLGKGHVKFFYDKGEYLRRRFEEEIVPELQRRGYNLTYTKYRMHPEGLNNDWQPDENAQYINRERIQERLNKKGERQ